jgi:hypothetical protein
MWASGHNGDIRRAAHGYEATREGRWPPSQRVGGAPGRLVDDPGLTVKTRCLGWSSAARL